MPKLPNIECSGCGACAQICPKKSISMKTNIDGFLYPVIDAHVCVECRLCEKVCPILQNDKNPTFSEEFSERLAFAAICKDEKIRIESSSGGVFSVLAKKTIMDGGVVFGAEFTSDFSVKHGYVDDIEELKKFRGSKYLQGRTEDSFEECKNFLESGRKVLYSGTPCQIGGLKSFLNKDYENLVTVDFICHGVPSPFLWRKYLEYHEKKSASRIVKTAFRRKNDGWKLFSLSFTFANDSEYSQPFTKDKYMQLFLRDNGLRESCYKCSFRGDNHKADLTIADYWGIENVMPEFFDDKGTSLVIVQTEKGKDLIEEIKDTCTIAKTDFYQAVKYNTSYFVSKKRPYIRDRFYRNFENTEIDTLFKKFGKESYIHRILPFVKRVIAFIIRKLKFAGNVG